jgi:hypothetical protein
LIDSKRQGSSIAQNGNGPGVANTSRVQCLVIDQNKHGSRPCGTDYILLLLFQQALTGPYQSSKVRFWVTPDILFAEVRLSDLGKESRNQFAIGSMAIKNSEKQLFGVM